MFGVIPGIPGRATSALMKSFLSLSALVGLLASVSAHAQPAIAIAARARWTLRAFAGGYCRRIDADQPEDNAYKVLMEGLESFAAMLRGVGLREDDKERNYDYTASGQRYLSARAR